MKQIKSDGDVCIGSKKETLSQEKMLEKVQIARRIRILKTKSRPMPMEISPAITNRNHLSDFGVNWIRKFVKSQQVRPWDAAGMYDETKNEGSLFGGKIIYIFLISIF